MPRHPLRQTCALILLTAGAIAVEPVAIGMAQSSSPSVIQRSPACACEERPQSRLHAARIVAECAAIAADSRQHTSKRLEAMKRRAKIARLVER